jgi:A/G-specific adenine glycosylase
MKRKETTQSTSPNPSPKPLPNPAFAAALLDWYDREAVILPWRGSRDPYHVWLSEIMLQQTRVATVESYYERFLARFPTIEALAAASMDEVLKAWEGLGYYTRARNLHRLALLIVNGYDGQFPATAEALQRLPGVGRYTAAAIASIAFAEPVAALDGNVVRILTRLIDLPDEVGQPAVTERLGILASALLSTSRPGDYNQALMDLGRTICTPRRPDCLRCPVREFCLASARGTMEQRPVKKRRAPLPLVRAAAAVIRDMDGHLLLVQRPAEGLLGGLWTLPGGPLLPSDTYAQCLQRWMRQSLGVQIQVAREMAVTTQMFTHFLLRLRAFECALINGEPGGEIRWAWVAPEELTHYSLGKADREILEMLEHWQPRLFEEP